MDVDKWRRWFREGWDAFNALPDLDREAFLAGLPDLDREQIKVWLVGLPDLDGEQLEPEPDYFEVEGMDGEQLGPKVDYFGIAALEREGREAEVEIAGWKPLCGPCAALNISPN